ncbi:bacteriohemerythrin [Desulfovibrio sp. OttesenSCG-928-C06]|nr:bacteriohemerythrin [Desulfovibrio sp. OttesenSCG-928-C06]
MKHATSALIIAQVLLLALAFVLHSGDMAAYVALAGALALAVVVIILISRSNGRESTAIMRYLASIRKNATEGARNGKNGSSASLPTGSNVIPERLSESGTALCQAIYSMEDSLAAALERAEKSEEMATDLREQLFAAKATAAGCAETSERIAADLHAVGGQTRTISDELSMELRHLSKMVSEIGDNIESQRFSLQSTSAAMERITGSVVEVSSHAASVSEDAQSSKSLALTGQAEVDGAVQAIETVSDVTVALKESMHLLGSRTENIGSVMAVISEVADQTNLLALNAAIEAARAGEAGRGFAVVADEVRKLAEKTMQATSEIEGVVRDIQESARDGIAAVERAAGHADESAGRAGKAGELMSAVVQGMDRAAGGLESIADSTQEQAQSTGLTNTALEQINQVAVNTAEDMQHFTSRLVSIQGKLEELEIIAMNLDSAKPGIATENVRLVNWTSDLETGIELIDSQHKMLCAYINSLHRASKRENSEDTVLDVVNCLKDYTATHFSTEEQYFSHSTYPHTEQHMEVHRKFVAKVTEVEVQLRLGRATVGDDLLLFLKDWLLNHIRVTDHQYIPFVKQVLKGKKQ